VARSRTRCSAVSTCTASSTSTGPATIAAAYSRPCAQPPTGQLTKAAIAAPQIRIRPPSSTPASSAAANPASAFLVARQVGADHSAPTTAVTRWEAGSAEVMAFTV